MAEYRILVTGSRDFTDRMVASGALEQVLKSPPHPHGTYFVTLIQGGAPGADSTLASEFENFGLFGLGDRIQTFRADWDKHGRAAGPLRNQQMVDSGADICLAFKKRGAGNVGTQDCIDRATKAGIPVLEFWEE